VGETDRKIGGEERENKESSFIDVLLVKEVNGLAARMYRASCVSTSETSILYPIFTHLVSSLTLCSTLSLLCLTPLLLFSLRLQNSHFHIALIGPAAKAAGMDTSRDSLFRQHASLVQDNLRVVLCVGPPGIGSRTKCRINRRLVRSVALSIQINCIVVLCRERSLFLFVPTPSLLSFNSLLSESVVSPYIFFFFHQPSRSLLLSPPPSPPPPLFL
jgi:hypothetical protein